MKYLKRSIYLLYYFKKLDVSKFRKFLSYAVKMTDRSEFKIFSDAVHSVFRYNISLMDYFFFRFFEKTTEERGEWAGTGLLYEYQLKMNPKENRDVLENKIKFFNKYSPLIRRMCYSYKELEKEQRLIDDLLNNNTGKIVLKNSFGQVGAQVEVINCVKFNPKSLIEYMKNHNYDMVEDFVQQHSSLMSLSPTGLNTIRIFTQLEQDQVLFLGARLRISVNSQVDNMGAGNLAAPVDIVTGIVDGPAVYSDISKVDCTDHPVTGNKIFGFSIPFWDEVKGLAMKAAQLAPLNRSVGWDIAVLEDGPELIEGNHNWCKLLWQLPVKKGLKSEIEKYL